MKGISMALLLGRKLGESIVIDNGKIRITVVEIRNNRVRLAIEAPRDVTIHREELLDSEQY